MGETYEIHDLRDEIRINLSDIRDEFSMREIIKNKDYLFNLRGKQATLIQWRTRLLT